VEQAEEESGGQEAVTTGSEDPAQETSQAQEAQVDASMGPPVLWRGVPWKGSSGALVQGICTLPSANAAPLAPGPAPSPSPSQPGTARPVREVSEALAADLESAGAAATDAAIQSLRAGCPGGRCHL